MRRRRAAFMIAISELENMCSADLRMTAFTSKKVRSIERKEHTAAAVCSLFDTIECLQKILMGKNQKLEQADVKKTSGSGLEWVVHLVT